MPKSQHLEIEMIELDSDGVFVSQNVKLDEPACVSPLQWTRSEQSAWARRYEQLEQWIELGQHHVRALRQKVQNLEATNVELREENARLRQKLEHVKFKLKL